MRRIWYVLGIIMLISAVVITGCGKSASPTGQAPKQETAADDNVLNLLAKGKQVPGMSFDYTMQAKDFKMSGKTWVQKDKMKMENNVEGQTIVAIYDGDDVYQYMPAQGMAMKFSIKAMQNQGNKPEPPSDYADKITKETYKLVDTTTYNGMKCKVIIYSAKDSKEQVKMWISEEYGLPLKVEVSGPEGLLMTSEYNNLKVGALPADTFKLPVGVEVQDMSRMMQNMPKPPSR